MEWDLRRGYPSVRQALLADNLVATSQPVAAQAGLEMFALGGNAVDAAVATAAALTVLEPCSNGIGSDAFAIVWDGGLHGLNASGRSPAAWDVERMRASGDGSSMPLHGWDAVTVPGAVSAWVELIRRFGRLDLPTVLAPAIRHAERGFLVTPHVAHAWQVSLPRLRHLPGFADVFSHDGAAPVAGQRWRLPGHAAGLRLIAQSDGEEFYRGRIAEAMVSASARDGGALAADDLAEHRCDWVGTVQAPFAGHDVHEIPPNGQGITALMALRILEHHDLHSHDPDSPQAQHLMIEAVKIAFADAYRHVSDPESMAVDVEDLLSDDYIAGRAALLDPSRAQEHGPGEPPRGGTVYLATADSDGRMVSMIQSNYMGFGSGVVIPEYGVSLQNRGHGFVLDDGHPNQVGPRKRPFHTIIPGFLMRGGEPVMSFGVMGGHMQPQGHVQALVRMLVHGMNPQEACDAPRFRWNRGRSVNLEGTMPAATVEALRAMGHEVVERSDSAYDFGTGQFIRSLGPENGYVAATDTRREGSAVGC